MGLIIGNTELESGIVAENAYARIELINWYKTGAEIGLRFYISQEAAESGKLHFRQIPYNFVPSVEDGADNFAKQGYEYLKTLLEFEDAKDC